MAGGRAAAPGQWLRVTAGLPMSGRGPARALPDNDDVQIRIEASDLPGSSCGPSPDAPRRAKLWLDAIPPDVLDSAVDLGLLVGRLGLTDSQGHPLCAGVRPPLIEWSAAAAR